MIVGRSMLREAGEFWRLEEAEFRRLVVAAREVDSVELKLVVPGESHVSACAALGVEWKRARTVVCSSSIHRIGPLFGTASWRGYAASRARAMIRS